MPTDIEYAQLSGRVYSRPQRNRTPLPSGWAQIRELTDGANGFSVGVYGKGDEIVIAYTGTNETVPDYVNGNVPAATQVIGDRPNAVHLVKLGVISRSRFCAERISHGRQSSDLTEWHQACRLFE
ncbi:MAG: hypothetical protein ACK51J_09895, partial [Burkholderiales bacterium]